MALVKAMCRDVGHVFGVPVTASQPLADGDCALDCIQNALNKLSLQEKEGAEH